MGPANSKVIVDTFNDYYRERITNILSRNTARVNNVINAGQNIKVVYNCPVGPCDICAGGYTIDQRILANMKVVTHVTQAQATEIASMIETDLSNKSSQTYKDVTGFLGNIGLGKNTEVTTRLVNRIRDIVRTDLTTENIVQIVNRTSLSQNQELVFNLGPNSTVGGKGCTFTQDMIVDLSSEAIIDMLVANTLEDATYTRMVNDAQQDTQIEARGLDDLVKAALSWTGVAGIIALAGAFAVAKLGAAVSPTATLTEVAKQKPVLAIFGIVLVIVLFVAIIYWPIAWLFSLWPFSGNRTLWRCETAADGLNTRKCVSGTFERGFKTQAECESSGVCDQFWGCEKKDGDFTGRCVQYRDAAGGPKRTQQDCETAIANREMCSYKFGGALTADGRYESPPRCVEFKDPTLGTYRTKAQCDENLAKFRNKWKCSAGRCSEVHPATDWAMYATESECKSGCGRE